MTTLHLINQQKTINPMTTIPIKSKITSRRRELAFLLTIDGIMLISLISLLIMRALIEPSLLVSAIFLLVINIAFFCLRSLYKYFLLIFLLLALFDVIKLSYFNIYVGNKFFSIELIALIMLVWFLKIYGNFLFTKKPKNEDSKLDTSFFKEKFKNLTKKELLDKLSDKQHLTQEATIALEELLNEKE